MQKQFSSLKKKMGEAKERDCCYQVQKKNVLSEISNNQLLLLAHVFKNKGSSTLDQQKFTADSKKKLRLSNESFSFAQQVILWSLLMILQGWKSRKNQSHHQLPCHVGQSDTPCTPCAIILHRQCESVWRKEPYLALKALLLHSILPHIQSTASGFSSCLTIF